MSKVFIEESTLTNIGAAIREKTGKTDLIAPGDMPTEIKAIQTGGGGGGIEVEPIVLTGDQKYSCAGKLSGVYAALFGDTISTNNISDASYMFYDYTHSVIPFDLNFDNTKSNIPFASMFESSNIVKLPKINNYPIVGTLKGIFRYCYFLKEKLLSSYPALPPLSL